MKEIPLTQGKVAIIDDEDFEYINQWKWYYTTRGYAVRNETIPGKGQRVVFMHRVILKTPDGLFTDHINQNKLDNRRSNLRICDRSLNGHNTGIRITNTSGYKGVSFFEGKWKAQIRIDGEKVYLGLFDTPEKASIAHNNKSIEVYGFSGIEESL